MDELIKAVAKEIGLPEAQAKKAVEAVLKFLKDKLTAPISSQIDNVLDKPAVSKNVPDLLKRSKGLFGK